MYRLVAVASQELKCSELKYCELYRTTAVRSTSISSLLRKGMLSPVVRSETSITMGWELTSATRRL